MRVVAFLSDSTAYTVLVVGLNVVVGLTADPLVVKAVLNNTLDIVGFTGTGFATAPVPFVLIARSVVPGGILTEGDTGTVLV